MKKITLLLVIAVLCFATPARAYQFAEDWSMTDTAWQSTVTALIFVDWSQTRWMAKRGWIWDGKYHHEMNPILGRHPSEMKVNILIPLGIIGHGFISAALPPKIKWNNEDVKIFDIVVNPRRIWQCVFIAGEVGAVGNNISIGAHFDF